MGHEPGMARFRAMVGDYDESTDGTRRSRCRRVRGGLRKGRRRTTRAGPAGAIQHGSQERTAARHRRRTRRTRRRNRRGQRARHAGILRIRHERRQTRQAQIRCAASGRRRARRASCGLTTRPGRRNRTRIPSGKRPAPRAGTRADRRTRHDLRSPTQRHRRRGLPMHQIRQRSTPPNARMRQR